MKTKSTIQSLGLAVLLTQAVSPSIAADLIVEENGVAPNFASISEAVLAASPGDRIFVRNMTGEGRYFENVVIDKPLTFLADVEGGTFNVGGTWSVSPNAVNFTPSNHAVRIVGMHNTAGGIAATANNTTGTTIMVDVHGCVGGSINLSGTGYAARISGNLVGSITAREAHVVGNQVTVGITINDGGATSVLGDTCYVVGNRLAIPTESPNSSNPVSGKIVWNNAAQYAHITNNHVYTSIGSLDQILSVNTMKSGTGRNLIANNSLRSSLTTTFTSPVFLNLPMGARLLFCSNAVRKEGSTPITAIQLAGSVDSCEIAHNVHGNLAINIAGGATGAVVHDNVQANSFTINTLTGLCDVPCIDGGYPTAEHTDHDGTRNDVGVAGGSFNPSNFWPLEIGSARVFLVKTPRVVVQGETIQVEASAVDR